MSKTLEQRLADIRQQIRGSVIMPEDMEYDDARALWNAMIDRRPAAIVRCASSDDVARTLEAARETQRPVTVRGGGHNIAGSAVCDDGIVVDLSPLASVQIDAELRRARVGPGARLGDFDAAAQEHGLATPLGINSTTGVAGLTLGGGFGWLSRRNGMTIDNLLAADVVTAEGHALRASADENPDLFWALRGGGGNFGIVTAFEFALQPVGPEVTAGLYVFPFDQTRTVLAGLRALAGDLPDECAVWGILRQAPPLPFLPETVHGEPVAVLAACHVGSPAAAAADLAPLDTLADTLGTHVGRQPYAQWQQAFDALLTPGARNYWKTHNFAGLDDDLIDILADHAGRLPTPECEILVAMLGGAVTRVPADATAYPHRDARFVMNVHGRWREREEDAAVIAWSRSLFNAAAPFATGGAYVNFMTEDESERVQTAYGPAYQRLAQLKRRYDPDNVFRINQNIRPTA